MTPTLALAETLARTLVRTLTLSRCDGTGVAALVDDHGNVLNSGKPSHDPNPDPNPNPNPNLNPDPTPTLTLTLTPNPNPNPNQASRRPTAAGARCLTTTDPNPTPTPTPDPNPNPNPNPSPNPDPNQVPDYGGSRARADLWKVLATSKNQTMQSRWRRGCDAILEERAAPAPAVGDDSSKRAAQQHDEL